MAVPTTNGSPIIASALADGAVCVRSYRRRRITPEAGRALEILAHAIEYLTDEFMNQGPTFFSMNEQLEAVLILMALNRQVYFECPEVPSFDERCCDLTRRSASRGSLCVAQSFAAISGRN